MASQPMRFQLDHYSGTREDRIRTIMKKLVDMRMSGNVEIHTDYQTCKFKMQNGKLEQSSSICSYADIIAHFE